MPRHEQRTRIPVPPEALFDWHARPGAFERLTPPWEDVRVVSVAGGLEAGARRELSAPLVGPVRGRWVAKHVWCERPHGFTDVQESGPFAAWEHTHRFEPDGEGSVLVDSVDWRAPFGPAGKLAEPMIRGRLASMFAWRHLRTLRDLTRHRESPLPPSRIGITGASGLVGSALAAFLTTGGHAVVALPRPGKLTAADLAPLDAVVHLAGAPIAERAWSPEVKAEILASRRDGTRALGSLLEKLPPKVLVSASAVGFYGDRGDEPLTEDSAPGAGFLAEVCQAWEAASRPAADAGWRVATVRVGLVISARGGLLGGLLPLFRVGGGGPVGSGRQWMPWVHLDDLVALIHRAIADPTLSGPLLGVAPNPVRNADFGRALGAALGRPAITPAPAFAVRLALGREKADELLLAGQNARPARVLASGFRFDEPELRGALAFELGS